MSFQHIEGLSAYATQFKSDGGSKNSGQAMDQWSSGQKSTSGSNVETGAETGVKTGASTGQGSGQGSSGSKK